MKWSWRNFSFILWDYISKQKYCLFCVFLKCFSRSAGTPSSLTLFPHRLLMLWVMGCGVEWESERVRKKYFRSHFSLDVFNNKMGKRNRKWYVATEEKRWEQRKKAKNPNKVVILKVSIEQLHTIQLSIDFIYKHWHNHILYGRTSPTLLPTSSTLFF